MDFGALIWLVIGGFLGAMGRSGWEWLHRKLNPPAATPTRHYMGHAQFASWPDGAEKRFQEARKAEGYEFGTYPEERIPAVKKDGWEVMVVDGEELWYMSTDRIPYAFVMRRPR